MTINFERKFKKEELGIQVRAVLGVPEEFLTDDVISSPVFITKASKYINKNFEKYEDDVEGLDKSLLKIAYVYYICYLLCTGMYARLPKQMENISTKTILLSIDWDSKAAELLNKCDEIIDDIIEELDGEETNYGNTFAVLSAESEYPNTNLL